MLIGLVFAIGSFGRHWQAERPLTAVRETEGQNRQAQEHIGSSVRKQRGPISVT
jgi:hypothetical protein